MIENIRSVHSDLQILRLADSHPLAEGGIKGPGSGKFHRLTAERTARAGFGILKENGACLCVGNRLNRAIRPELRGDSGTLRIGNSREIGTEERPEIAIPLNLSESLRRE